MAARINAYSDEIDDDTGEPAIIELIALNYYDDEIRLYVEIGGNLLLVNTFTGPWRMLDFENFISTNYGRFDMDDEVEF